ncbi:MAG: hypothetical protein H8D80_01290 [Proteobacteria bacterium]|nr:hypothetical protein [Pseudomonadota bacterium]
MSALDIFVAYKFIKILTTPFNKTDAFKLGVIDKNGKILKKRKDLVTGKEKMSMTIFHTLGWNIKKLLAKFPPTKTKLGSFAAALYLLKEEAKCNDEYLIENVFKDFLHTNGYTFTINESITETVLRKGDYSLVVDIDTPKEPVHQGDIVRADKDTEHFTLMMGKPLFKVTHLKSGKILVVSDEDLEKI